MQKPISEEIGLTVYYNGYCRNYLNSLIPSSSKPPEWEEKRKESKSGEKSKSASPESSESIRIVIVYY